MHGVLLSHTLQRVYARSMPRRDSNRALCSSHPRDVTAATMSWYRRSEHEAPVSRRSRDNASALSLLSEDERHEGAT